VREATGSKRGRHREFRYRAGGRTASGMGAGQLGWVLALLSAVLLLAGCEDDSGCVSCVDSDPAPPSGLFSVTGDGMVTLFWYRVWDEDVVEYVVYRASGYTEPYHEIGRLGFAENYDEVTDLNYFEVDGLTNGQQWFYAVSCLNRAGRESALSSSYVPDTSRPEGYELELTDFNANPDYSGYDFSLNAGYGAYDNPTPPTTADVYVVFTGGHPYVQAARPDFVSLQDYGTFFDGQYARLDWVDYAPVTGYSETGSAELIVGHAYIVRIEESPGAVNYAKFAVTGIGLTSVVVDWAYQPVTNSRELKALSGPKPPASNAELIRF
jgi:hypothetical protein